MTGWVELVNLSVRTYSFFLFKETEGCCNSSAHIVRPSSLNSMVQLEDELKKWCIFSLLLKCDQHIFASMSEVLIGFDRLLRDFIHINYVAPSVLDLFLNDNSSYCATSPISPVAGEERLGRGAIRLWRTDATNFEGQKYGEIRSMNRRPGPDLRMSDLKDEEKLSRYHEFRK